MRPKTTASKTTKRVTPATKALAPAPTPAPLRGTLSTKEAADYLGIAYSYMFRIQKGLYPIPVVRIGRRVLFRIVDLDTWLAARVEGQVPA